jgi:hypothetical protein
MRQFKNPSLAMENAVCIDAKLFPLEFREMLLEIALVAHDIFLYPPETVEAPGAARSSIGLVEASNYGCLAAEG